MGSPPDAPPPDRTAEPHSAELLQLIFDHAGEGIGVFDASLQLTAWNQRLLEFTGLDATQVFRGAAMHDLLQALARAGEFGSENTEAEVHRRLAEARQGVTIVRVHRRPNGRILEFRRNPTPGGGFVMLCADITERVASEAALVDQQRMLSLLLERTEQGFWFIGNDLCTTDANPAMCRMLGLPLAQLMGRNIFDFVDEHNAAIFREHVRLRALGHAEGYEITLRRADTSEVHCYNNATPIVDAAGRKIGAVGLFSDISALRRAQQQLRQAGEQLALKSKVLGATLESLVQGVMSVDPAGRIIAHNRRLLELLEIPETLIQSHPTLSALARYQLEQGHFGSTVSVNVPALGHERQLGDIGENHTLAPKYQRTRLDGTVLEVQTHFADDGSVVRTYTDVTASVTAQRALAESETRFRTMADAAPALIWQSQADGTTTWFNQRWLSYTGRTMTEELACPWSQRLHPDDYERSRLAFAEAFSRRSNYDIELRLRRADGDYAWISDNGIPRFGPDGRFEGYISHGWDITERKAAEVALIAAKEEAERANRAKSEFLSRMSHELRTPLNAVLGFAQLLEADAVDPLNQRQRNRVQELMRGGRHLLSLINEVLDLATIEAGSLQLHLEPVDLAATVDECLRMVQPMATERGIGLVSSTPSATPASVLADPTRLKQVLLNLLSNGIKYNRSGGMVRLAWHPEYTDGGTDATCVRIEVSDDGPGLSAAQQDKLFQAFERLHPEHNEVEGTGIGLALSKWLVELMRGEIGVRSSPGAGSTFWIRVSCSHASTSNGPPAASPDAERQIPVLVQTPSASAPRTVLYIEDNMVNQLLMEGMLLQRPNIRLMMAEHPSEGLSMAASHPPDLVLLDIQLPDMDGFEVLRRLRQSPATRHVPVIAVSANAMQADIDEAARAGFIEYVTKPLDLARLLDAVDRAMR